MGDWVRFVFCIVFEPWYSVWSTLGRDRCWIMLVVVVSTPV